MTNIIGIDYYGKTGNIIGYKLASFDKLSSLEVLTFAHQTKDSVEKVDISKGKPLKSIDDYYKY